MQISPHMSRRSPDGGEDRAVLTSPSPHGGEVLALVTTLFIPCVSGIVEFPGKKCRRKIVQQILENQCTSGLWIVCVLNGNSKLQMHFKQTPNRTKNSDATMSSNGSWKSSWVLEEQRRKGPWLSRVLVVQAPVYF